MAKDHGVIVYDIYPNGCLNGICADTFRGAENKIYNEILKKKSTEINFELDGNYLCSYMSVDDTIVNCEVEIRTKNGKIQIGWIEDGVRKYEGTGWKTRENQLTVSYRYL